MMYAETNMAAWQKDADDIFPAIMSGITLEQYKSFVSAVQHCKNV